MGPKKNKNKPNAFLYFMQDVKPQIEKRVGRRVSMMEMPALCTADWKNLPVQEREKYEKKAHSDRAGKMDSRGRLLTEIEDEEKEKKRRQTEMHQTIGNIVGGISDGNVITSYTFIVAAMSYYVRVDEGKFVPAELSMVKFNFEEGIYETFQRIIAAKIPAGFKFEAIQHSEAEHNIPLNLAEAERELDNVRRDLFAFLKQEDDNLSILYTMDDKMEFTQDMLDTCFGKDLLKVFSLELFFQNLYFAARPEKSVIPKVIAREMLQSCKLDYRLNLGCKWHRINAPDSVLYCTLSCCQRWLFLMCDELCIKETMGITPKTGKHYPLPDSFNDSFCPIDDDDEEDDFNPPETNAWVTVSAKQAPSVASCEAFPALGMGRGRGRGIMQANNESLQSSFGSMSMGGTGPGPMIGQGRGVRARRQK